MNTTHMGSLSAAHRGYAYQDLVTAYLLVRALVYQHEAVIVDRKTVEDDRFDDLEVTANGTRTRRQLKSRVNPDLALSLQDFVGHGSSLDTLQVHGIEAVKVKHKTQNVRVSVAPQQPKNSWPFKDTPF